MKKPDIDMQSKRMMVDTKLYSEMIDGLLAVNNAIENKIGRSGGVWLGGRLELGIKDLLKKAGCK